jgi:hypothetical protein
MANKNFKEQVYPLTVGNFKNSTGPRRSRGPVEQVEEKCSSREHRAEPYGKFHLKVTYLS